MVTIKDISDKCFELSQKHGLGVEGAKDFMNIALLTLDHCQERLGLRVEEEPPRG